MKASKFLFFYFFYLFFNTSYANADFDPLPKSNCTKHNLELKRDYLSIDLEEYQWITNMLKAKLNASEIFKIYKIKKETSLHLPPILQKYKKWKKAKVTYHYKNGLKCTGRGRIRLTGDFTDHLSSKTFIGSFAMRINDFHIYNNTRFKVLYPQSRNHDNEIFINSFFKEIGFLAPDTRSVSVRLGKIGKINMILQDEINKEFLEKNNRVEGPIIESNEFIKWRYARNKTQVEKILPYEVRYSLPKIKNSNWALRTEDNMFDTLLALKALNKVYFQNITDHGKNFRSRYYVYPNFNLINQENHSQFNQLNCINEILKIPHLSILSNRIFYYNYINHSVEPIIYDTNFHISSVIKNKNQNIEDSRCDSDSLKKLLDKVSKINEEKFLEKLSEKGINIKDFKNFLKIKDRILNYPSNDRLKNKPNFEIDKKFVLDFYKNREYNSDNIKKTIVFSNYEKNRSFQICVNKDNCKKLELKKKDIKKLIEGKLKRKNEYFQLVSIENLNPEVLISEKNLNIYKIGNFKDIIIDKKKKIIQVTSKDYNSRLLFLNSDIKEYKIIFKNFDNNKKYNLKKLNNLRGCLNFYETKLNNVNFHIENCKLEDGINFIKSKGTIDNIYIHSSSSDAIDSDFSTLKFNNINIINAKNDCIDFSFGNYFIKKADLKNCGDKGISVGEKSRLSLLEGNITRSSLGLAAKDDAVVNIISNLSIHVKKDKQCFAEYRKKQEFDHGTIINKNKINCFD